MEEKILPKLISKFGKVISIEAFQRKRLVQFERNGTLFELKVTGRVDGSGDLDGTVNVIQFKLSNKSFFGASWLAFQLLALQSQNFFLNNRDLFSQESLIPSNGKAVIIKLVVRWRKIYAGW